MTRYQLLLALLYFLVLLVILPVFCSDKVYSIFYQEDPLRDQEAEVVKREHRRRGVKEYLQEVNAHESLPFYTSLLHEPLDNLIVVLAKTPRHQEDRILSQLVTEVDRNIHSQRLYHNGLVICNASRTPFQELQELSRLYPVVQAENTSAWKLFNTEETIRHDFMDCIRQGQRLGTFKYLTLIKDVMVPYTGFLETLNQLLYLRLSHETLRGELRARTSPWLFLHLHEPVPLRQYELSGNCIWELIVLAISGGLLFFVVFRYLEGPSLPLFMRVTYIFYGAIYFVTFATVVGRPYITELRRLAASFYRVYDPPEPIHFSAMTFPSSSLKPLLQQLNTLRCSQYSPFHEALDHMVNTLEYPGFVVSPSFVSYAVRSPPPS